ncbi:g6526 [Coccomyxa viridis]|uniref:G6526 protein n=1 Tax=Coccomyxa viridis TaxID=1274662 RepID=A0ABP1FVJ2_9CHLO
MVVGKGIYVLYDDGRNVRLLYELEVPMYPQEAQQELGIDKAGDYAIQVRNPWKDHPRTVNPPQRAAYPSDYQKLFQGSNVPKSDHMWIPPREPALLDHKNAVFMLIGRSPNWHHQFKNLPQSLAELLDQAIKEDLGPEAYSKGIRLMRP